MLLPLLLEFLLGVFQVVIRFHIDHVVFEFRCLQSLLVLGLYGLQVLLEVTELLVEANFSFPGVLSHIFVISLQSIQNVLLGCQLFL